MHILGLVAENYKRIKVVEINPQGHVVQITGRNGQGKTSVLDAIWTALAGKRALPEKPVRKGAERCRIRLNLGELIVQRTIASSGTQSLLVETAKGVKVPSPQTVLDELLSSLAFDPLEFIKMKPAEQIETLRKVTKLEYDFEKQAAANDLDYQERHRINLEVRRLQTEMATISVQENLPAARIETVKILAEISAADAKNAKARQRDDARTAVKNELDQLAEEDTQLSKEIKQLQAKLEKNRARAHKLGLDYEKAPAGEYVQVAQLSEQLRQAEIANREIDKRAKRDELEKQLKAAKESSDRLTRAMEQRAQSGREAIANAKMPVEGLTFDENLVRFNGIPIEQLGGAEQIRVSTAIAMAMNPKLRVIRIMHGEELDEENLAIFSAIAEQHDFQIWMARVDTSGKVGIVMEDGMVKGDAHE